MAGKVWLVGAGPSDVELLTRKAERILSRADVVVYDSLVGKAILAEIPSEADAIDVGKRAGNHTLPQEEINRLLAELAMEGKQVVRLKGGDPFLFGRGGEEAEYLQQKGISYEVVPGVPSATSVCAYAGIPVTHRDAASMVHIITGHKKKDESLEIDFSALVQAGGTLVFLMGLSALEDIVRGLLDAGMQADTPAAVVGKGTTAKQYEIFAKLADLPEEVRRQKAETPAIIVVGEVCHPEHLLTWRKQLPLAGRRYVVTRPKNRSRQLTEQLRELGAEVIEFPTIRTIPFRENPRLKKAVEHMQRYDILAFTSPAAVEYFFDFLKNCGKDIRCIGTVKLAAIGTGTKRALQERGLVVDFLPEVYDGVHFGKLLYEVAGENGRILLPRAKEGNPQVVEEIRKRRDLEVTEIPLYETVYERSKVIDLKQEISANEVTEAVFTSASTLRGFLAAAEGADVTKVKAYCIGAMTAAEAEKAGMQYEIAKEASVDGLVELILNR